MENVTAKKVGDIMAKACDLVKSGRVLFFADAVGVAFWQSFGKHEQSQLMQDVYITLCDMDYTPLEAHQAP